MDVFRLCMYVDVVAMVAIAFALLRIARSLDGPPPPRKPLIIPVSPESVYELVDNNDMILTADQYLERLGRNSHRMRDDFEAALNRCADRHPDKTCVILVS